MAAASSASRVMARGIRRTGAAGQPPLPRALTWLDLGYLASGPGTSALPVPTGMRYGSHMPNKEDLYDAAVDLFGDGKLEEAVARYEEALALDPGYVDAWVEGERLLVPGDRLLED